MAVWDKYFKHPLLFKSVLNVWPPFVGAGISIVSISKDFRKTTVQLQDRIVNRNYVGSHFGGSLFAMTDPFLMLMLIQILGSKYYVWDIGAEIKFLKPAYGTVKVTFEVTDADIAEIRQATAQGTRFEKIYKVEILNTAGEVVAEVNKAIYIRLKSKHRPNTKD